MSAENVVWNIEALMNARYANAGDPFANSFIKKDIISIPLNDGMVRNEVLPSAVESTRIKLAQQYNAIEGDKHIISVDINISPIENNYLNLEITSVIGENTSNMSEPFNILENWRWGLGQGKCDRTRKPYDAGIRLAQEINLRFPRPFSRIFFTDNMQRIHTPGYDDLGMFHSYRTPGDAVLDNIHDYLFYHTTTEYSETNFNAAECVNPDDMNWYYQNLFNRINIDKSQQAQSDKREFNVMNIMSDSHLHIDSTFERHTIRRHFVFITYGKPIHVSCNTVCDPNYADACTIECLQP